MFQKVELLSFLAAFIEYLQEGLVTPQELRHFIWEKGNERNKTHARPESTKQASAEVIARMLLIAMGSGLVTSDSLRRFMVHIPREGLHYHQGGIPLTVSYDSMHAFKALKQLFGEEAVQKGQFAKHLKGDGGEREVLFHFIPQPPGKRRSRTWLQKYVKFLGLRPAGALELVSLLQAVPQIIQPDTRVALIPSGPGDWDYKRMLAVDYGADGRLRLQSVLEGEITIRDFTSSGKYPSYEKEEIYYLLVEDVPKKTAKEGA